MATKMHQKSQRQPNINKIPPEKQQERKQSAENLSEDKLNELRRKTIGEKRKKERKKEECKGGVQGSTEKSKGKN